MIFLQINDKKTFMNQLLTLDTFDSFLLAEATITTYNMFFIDGRIVKEFISSDDTDTTSLGTYEFSLWEHLRAICFNLIKGKRTPVNFKFVMHLKPELITNLLEKSDCSVTLDELKAFVLTIKFDSTGLSCTTATAFHSFSLDKTPDKLWDTEIKQFFAKHNIVFEEL